MSDRDLKSVHIQARLHPDSSTAEAQALNVWAKRRTAGQQPRDILTDALLALDGLPIYVPETGLTPETIRQAFEGMRDTLADLLGDLLDERLDELIAMSPRERRQSIKDAARSSFSDSIQRSIDVADYEEPEQ